MGYCADPCPTSPPQQTERRAVRSEDPSLSPRANQLLTHELREALGTDEVTVPKGAPDRRRDEHATTSAVAATLVSNRPILIVTFLAAIVIGGIVALHSRQGVLTAVDRRRRQTTSSRRPRPG